MILTIICVLFGLLLLTVIIFLVRDMWKERSQWDNEDKNERKEWESDDYYE